MSTMTTGTVKWFNPDKGFGRYVALGEYIVELCEIEPHDEWPYFV